MCPKYVLVSGGSSYIYLQLDNDESDDDDDSNAESPIIT